MSKIKQFLDRYCSDIILKLDKKEFDTHDVIFEINQNKKLQKEYIRLSEQYGSYNILNAQIGRYLAFQQKKLRISKNGGKKVSITNTGRQSINQKWRKVILLIPILVLLMNSFSYSQTLSPQKNSKSRWGYVNESGKVAIKYKYDYAQKFSEELAVIGKKGKYGFIDKAGKVIIPLIYDDANNFSKGIATVEKLGKWGIIDKSGREIIPLKYDEIDNFSNNGLAKVNNNSYWGVIDQSGSIIVHTSYHEIGDFSEDGLAKVRKNKDWGFVDKTGKEVVPVIYDEISNFSEEGLAKVTRGGEYGIIDKTGRVIAHTVYHEIGDFSEDGLAFVRHFSNYGFIDKTGKKVIPLIYDDARDFSKGYAAVKYNKRETDYGLWGVIDKTGKEILPGDYKESEILNMMTDYALLQKEVQSRQEKGSSKKMFIVEVEAVLAEDYYSTNCHSVVQLEELREKIKQMEDELPFSMKTIDEKTYLTKLSNSLLYAIKTQKMTKKYGVETAKIIMTGKYEIGMSKAVCKEIAGGYFSEVMNKTARTETWKINKSGFNDFIYLIFEGNKLFSITY